MSGKLWLSLDWIRRKQSIALIAMTHSLDWMYCAPSYDSSESRLLWSNWIPPFPIENLPPLDAKSIVVPVKEIEHEPMDQGVIDVKEREEEKEGKEKEMKKRKVEEVGQMWIFFFQPKKSWDFMFHFFYVHCMLYLMGFHGLRETTLWKTCGKIYSWDFMFIFYVHCMFVWKLKKIVHSI